MTTDRPTERRPSGLTVALDRYQRRHRWAGFPIAVAYKFYDDQGGYLAALITYYGFVSLFPLLLLLTTLLGFVLQGDPALQERVVRSALRSFPVIGTQLRDNVHSLRGSGSGLVVGVLGMLYGGLGVAQALQNALNRVWSVPRNERPDPLRSRVRSLAMLLVLGAGVLATTGLSAVGAASHSFGADVGRGVRMAAVALSVVANVGLFVVGFRTLTARAVRVGDVLVGAVCAAVGWQVLQSLGTYYLAHKLSGAREVYGMFGFVLGLLAWIYLEAVVVVLCAEVNAVRVRRLWPRALLTPFTDRVDLTPADARAYASYARAERFKGFERVHVEFDREPAKPGSEHRD